MAKKTDHLTFQDIVLGADVETIRQALEARQEIDRLLAEREEAYRRIADLETQVDRLMGETGDFPFPEPPLPVFGMVSKKTPKTSPKATKTAVKAPSASSEPRAATPPAADNESEA